MPDDIQVSPAALRGYIEYLRDLGVADLYRCGSTSEDKALAQWIASLHPPAATVRNAGTPKQGTLAGKAEDTARSRGQTLTPFERDSRVGTPITAPAASLHPPPPAAFQAQPPVLDPFANDQNAADGIHLPQMAAPQSFNVLAPLPAAPVPKEERASALAAIRAVIGDCTRCPLAYAGRHNIVFADGDPSARLMFVGEGPGADEDATGVPFIGKAGQLLNNMVQAMGLQRAEVYIANIVKCRPPKNRVPEPVEATTCSQFLVRQIDVVQPEVIVALGATAATYLLGVKQSLASLRGRWFDVRGSKCAVTYHPAFLLRDPRQKGEAWKDLQRVMAELKLEPPARR